MHDPRCTFYMDDRRCRNRAKFKTVPSGYAVCGTHANLLRREGKTVEAGRGSET